MPSRVFTRDIGRCRRFGTSLGSKQNSWKPWLPGRCRNQLNQLKFLGISVDALLLCGESGIPLDICVMPISGGTGPKTMAGNLLILSTEFLNGVVTCQSANQGAPL